jgi:hypothetical protein
MSEKKTPSCEKIYRLLELLGSRKENAETVKELTDAFNDFECAWKDHSNEYHT